jgi:hypothetical protein
MDSRTYKIITGDTNRANGDEITEVCCVCEDYFDDLPKVVDYLPFHRNVQLAGKIVVTGDVELLPVWFMAERD